MFKKVLNFLGNSLKAILQGKFLLRLGVARYLGQVLYVFLLIVAIIWISLKIDSTLMKVENNKALLKDLRTVATIKRFELEKRNSRDVTLEMLRSHGSKLRQSEIPASRIEIDERVEDK